MTDAGLPPDLGAEGYGGSGLRERIRSGQIPVGRRIPSQAELEAETGGTVSRRTIKSATELLIKERLVEGVQGKGTFVVALPE
ncbi:winged helix-turn-helix transcriptional regulator [Streptomyces sp. UH6]|nr:winged helix-turn-helix transcriptional regulator [Streptomyces sp. UH6]